MRKFYDVKKGDTLWGLSKHFNLNINDLVEWNQLHGAKKHHISIGQRIYLEAPKNTKTVDTILNLRILDLGFNPIKRAKLSLEYDGSVHAITCDDQGEVRGIQIEDHTKGLKVHFRNIEGKFDLVAHHKKLPVGKKRLTLTSRTLKVDGETHAVKGAEHRKINDIKREVKGAVKAAVIPPSEEAKTPAKPLPQKEEETSSAQPNTKNSERITSSNTDAQLKNEALAQTKTSSIPINQPKPLKPKIENSRTDEGKPTTTIAKVLASDNFMLPTVNAHYIEIIKALGKKHGFPPHGIAAFINAEAGSYLKKWNPAIKAVSTSATGLMQFLDDTWLRVAKWDSTMLYHSCIKNKYMSVEETVDSKGVKKKNFNVLKSDSILALRSDPELSIDAGIVYGLYNLKYLNDPVMKGYPSYNFQQSSLTPVDKIKLMYICHHEGLRGAQKFIANELSDRDSKSKFIQQIGKKFADILIKAANGDAKKAYFEWMCDYIDRKINPYNFILDPKLQNATSTLTVDIIKMLNGSPSSSSKNTESQTAIASASATETIKNSAKDVIFSLVFLNKSNNKGVPYFKYTLRSRYGDKPHICDENGVDKVIKASVGDELSILINNQDKFNVVVIEGMPKTNVLVDPNDIKAEPLPAVGSLVAEGWSNPLAINKLRTAGLGPTGMLFGKGVRTPHKKNPNGIHQGIDLQAVPGTELLSISNGVVNWAGDTGGAYGKVVIIEIPKGNLPASKQALVNGDKVWFMYAHMDTIYKSTIQKFTSGLPIALSEPIGTSGSTGNAKGMNTINSGAHLHFEVHNVAGLLGKGLSGRINPLPFIDGLSK